MGVGSLSFAFCLHVSLLSLALRDSYVRRTLLQFDQGGYLNRDRLTRNAHF